MCFIISEKQICFRNDLRRISELLGLHRDVFRRHRSQVTKPKKSFTCIDTKLKLIENESDILAKKLKSFNDDKLVFLHSKGFLKLKVKLIDFRYAFPVSVYAGSDVAEGLGRSVTMQSLSNSLKVR